MEKDLALIKRVLKGNRAAFSTLVRQYQNYVFTICFRVLKNQEEAEEAAQDTFIKVHKTLVNFKEDSKFSTWLYTVAFRTAIDHSRRKKMNTDSIDKEDSYLQIEDKMATPIESMESSNLKEVLSQIIQTLPPVDASIVTLFYQGEKTVKEIAKVLDLSESNVKVKLYRLRESLKVKLTRYLREEVKDLL